MRPFFVVVAILVVTTTGTTRSTVVSSATPMFDRIVVVDTVAVVQHPWNISSVSSSVNLSSLEALLPLLDRQEGETLSPLSSLVAAKVHQIMTVVKEEPVVVEWCNVTSTTTSTASWWLLSDALDWYNDALESNPVMTKSITAGLMGAMGDILAQTVEGDVALDMRRVAAMAAEGLFLAGPLMHYFYEVLEEALPIVEGDNTTTPWYSWYMTVCQVLVDIFVFDSFFVATMILTSALLEGRIHNLKRHQLTYDYVAAVKVSWINSLFWMPIQCLSFKYIPFSYRVAAINVQDIAWNASISYMAHRRDETIKISSYPQHRHNNNTEVTQQQSIIPNNDCSSACYTKEQDGLSQH